jgi:hypothetical protein
MTIDFLTPLGGLIALAVLVPIAAFLAISRRAARLRRDLGLPESPLPFRLVPAVAVLAVAGLLGLAATQPLLERPATRRVRSDAEVLMVVDISRSMLAQRSLAGPARLERARVTAARLRASLPDVPVGIASLTNRVLPHLFPSPNEAVFRATLERAIDIERPPPGSSFIAVDQPSLRNATNLASLAAVASQRFYSRTARHRLLVVLTDGESSRVSASALGRRLRGAAIETVFIHFWAPDERVFSNGRPEPEYRSNPAARSILDRLAVATQGSVFDEDDLGAAGQRAREVVGDGPVRVETDERRRTLALAPYLAAAALVPLALLLWRRDR